MRRRGADPESTPASRGGECPLSLSLKNLRALPTDQLIEQHDRAATHTSVGVNYYLQELERRDQQAATKEMVRLTRFVAILTGVITALTAINVVAVFAAA